jgi:23S rRNA (guanosine2251-2'-O)-methyltransferase
MDRDMAGKHRRLGHRPPRVDSRPQERDKPRPDHAPAQGGLWLYGLHTVRAALANPRRKIRRAVFTERAAADIGKAAARVSPEIVAPEAVSRLLPHGAVHQGAALLCEPLPARDLDDVLKAAPAGRRFVAVLDQVTDPHNEGAILRSAVAFGFAAVIVQDRHAPPESGALAKAASGALDEIPRIAVVNIARALEDLGKLGFWRIALAADGDEALKDAAPPGDVAIVLGAEGTGIRRLVRERCDQSAYIPMAGSADSLNVSNAAAIAFYELRRKG